MFPNLLWITNLDFVFFKSQALFTILHCACFLIFGSRTISNSIFFNKFKTIYILRLKQGLNIKNPLKRYTSTEWIKKEGVYKIVRFNKVWSFLFFLAFVADTLIAYFWPFEFQCFFKSTFWKLYSRTGEKHVVVLVCNFDFCLFKSKLL